MIHSSGGSTAAYPTVSTSNPSGTNDGQFFFYDISGGNIVRLARSTYASYPSNPYQDYEISRFDSTGLKQLYYG